MKRYRITTVSDSDGDVSPFLEAWWAQGGALLWNQYGGLGSNSIDLDEDQWNGFLLKAQAIHGWRSQPEQVGQALDYGPMILADVSENDEIGGGDECHSNCAGDKGAAGAETRCCGDCGRFAFEGLIDLWNRDAIPVAKIPLNHLLNSLREAIDYAKGNGPNNHRTWQAALVEFVDSLDQIK